MHDNGVEKGLVEYLVRGKGKVWGMVERIEILGISGGKFLNGLQIGGGKWQNSWANMLKCFKFSCTERKNNV